MVCDSQTTRKHLTTLRIYMDSFEKKLREFFVSQSSLKLPIFDKELSEESRLEGHYYLDR